MTAGRAAVAAAIITAIGGILVALIQVVGPAFLDGGPTQRPGPTFPGQPSDEAAVFLSKESGPGGSTVNVSGRGFAPGETVELRFHTETVGTTRADAAGQFANVAITVPGSFSVFAPQQFDVIATGRSSLRSATAPFTISG